MQSRSFQVVADVYQRMLGVAITGAAIQFIQHVGWSMLGLGGANVLLLLTVVWAARVLGPAEFGRYVLAFAIANVLAAFMGLGMDIGVVREVGRARERARVVISSALFVVVLAAVVLAGGAWFLADWSLVGQRLSPDVLRWAVGLAALLATRTYFEAAARSVQAFRQQAHARLIDAFVVLLVFGLWIQIGEVLPYWSLLVSLMIGAAVATALLGFELRPLLSWQNVQHAEMLSLWRQVRFALVGAVGGLLLMSADKLLINREVGSVAFGIYAVYYALTVQVAGQISYIFINAFFPLLAAVPNTAAILRVLDRLLVALIVPALVGLSILTLVGLWILGHNYPVDGRLLLAMSVYGYVFFVWYVYWWWLVSTGRQGVYLAGVHQLIGGGLYIGLLSALLPRLGLQAAPVAFLVVGVYFAWIIRARRIALRSEDRL